ncbi:MAG: hypothetical protein K0Q49_2384 [Haloplasmataceae bacterium]|jgi:hypothetical protein|nr:hypothetical protein [Haloplasmataceae bacterium]
MKGGNLMAESLTDITTAVGSVVTMATTGELAVFFYGGVATLGIAIFNKLRKR